MCDSDCFIAFLILRCRNIQCTNAAASVSWRESVFEGKLWQLCGSRKDPGNHSNVPDTWSARIMIARRHSRSLDAFVAFWSRKRSVSPHRARARRHRHSRLTCVLLKDGFSNRIHSAQSNILSLSNSNHMMTDRKPLTRSFRIYLVFRHIAC